MFRIIKCKNLTGLLFNLEKKKSISTFVPEFSLLQLNIGKVDSDHWSFLTIQNNYFWTLRAISRFFLLLIKFPIIWKVFNVLLTQRNKYKFDEVTVTLYKL